MKRNCEMKDQGISIMPWVMMYFFVAVCLFLLLFFQSMHISTKYLVQDGLAAAALAGEIADLTVLSLDKEVIVTDLDCSRNAFEESLRASLNLSSQGYPKEGTIHFDSSVPIKIEELKLFNVTQGQIYETNLLQATGVLEYVTGTGLIPDSRCVFVGPLRDNNGNYANCIRMQDGSQKEIRATSLYARISFGIVGYDGSTVMIEKDILTDILENHESWENGY